MLRIVVYVVAAALLYTLYLMAQVTQQFRPRLMVL